MPTLLMISYTISKSIIMAIYIVYFYLSLNAIFLIKKSFKLLRTARTTLFNPKTKQITQL